MTSPTLFYDLAEEVLAAAVDALNAVLPPEHQHDGHAVVNGPPAIDDWPGCGHRVWAWVEVITPTQAPPNPQTGRIICQAPSPLIQVTVETWRCEPTIGDDKTLPSTEELENAARLVAVDAFVVWNALAQWALTAGRDPEVGDEFDDDEDPERDIEVAMGLSTPVPPSGGLVGWQTRLVVSPTDPSCPTAALKAIPDGWLPEVEQDTAGDTDAY